ncbi:polyprenyl diphosphate synthase [Actinomadura sp. 6N118]|uniref:polyprenyl diphosphate synthase n=1 Tax=Actinomadura sp. 6N118 TaxID=3375151 RepID=UPI00379F2A3C
MPGNETMDVIAPELRESYGLCERVGQRRFKGWWAAIDLLPVAVRPHFHAVAGFAVRTDGIADEGELAERESRLAQWCADSLADVRTGRSEHPLRRAFVHTMREWDLDVEVVAEFLEATRGDCAALPAFETFADQRRYLRGVAGTIAELVTPLLEPGSPEAARVMSVLGELCQLADIVQDFPIDLAAGRCYLPGQDVRRLGLGTDDLRRGEPHEALDELIGIQVARAHDLLQQTAPAPGMVAVSCQPFVHALILGQEFFLHEVERLGSRVLTEGVDPTVLRDTALRPHREPLADLVVPTHVAVIMDGNRRWAALRGLTDAEGHSAGMRAMLRLVHSTLRLGISHLSVFAFSTENWGRSPQELADLFARGAEGITRATEWLHGHNVRVRWCGRRDRLEESLASALAIVENMTSNNTALTLNIFVDYGGRDELVGATRALAAEAVAGTIRPENIGPADIARHCYAPDLPEVDLLIRTSGEQRISNFLPWHLTYAELVFDLTHWPDFGYHELRAAIADYTTRRRRFGGDNPDIPWVPEAAGDRPCAPEAAGDR